MRIAFVSYEYPPETGGGGIGTYLECVAPALAEAGHEVTIFCGGERSCIEQESLPQIVRVASSGPDFASAVLAPFSRSHSEIPFDVVEVTDFAAWGLEIQRRFPDLPTVAKLHTPVFVVDELHGYRDGASTGFRRPMWWLRDRLKSRSGERRRLHKREVESLKRATAVASPTFAVLQRVSQTVPCITEKARVYPYPFEPSPHLLAALCPGTAGIVTYLGRLEPRKGVLDLGQAIPSVCRSVPYASFRMIGRDMASGQGHSSCAEVIRAAAGEFLERLEILPALPREHALDSLAASDVCVFPSHWESFGLVTLEAMAAARAVIVTAGSGMAELVSHGETGVIVRPNDPEDLAAAITRLLGNPSLRRQLGLKARERVMEHFSLEAVVPTQLDHYQSVVARKGLAAVSL